MEFPFEGTLNTAIEKIADGIITKINLNEEKRNREFTYKLKELEFYKSNYEKDLKDIFDYWFELVRVTHIKDNENLTEQERQNHQKKYKDLLSTNKISRYKMNSLKYGGTETGRILAIQNLLLQEEYSDQPKTVSLYVWCVILSVLKKDILGQDLDPVDVIRVLVNDYDKNKNEIEEAQKYVVDLYKYIYKDNPKWAI